MYPRAEPTSCVSCDWATSSSDAPWFGNRAGKCGSAASDVATRSIELETVISTRDTLATVSNCCSVVFASAACIASSLQPVDPAAWQPWPVLVGYYRAIG